MPPSATERPIDRAVTLAAAGDAASALRYVLPMLKSQPGSALAAFVVGHSLRLLQQPEPASRAFRLAANSAINASNLALAVACGIELEALGSDPGTIFDEVASVFSRGSPRLGERRPEPPELPGAEPDFEPLPESLSAESLSENVTAVLAQLSADGNTGEARQEPAVFAQPLFSSLDRDSLRELVTIFDVRILATGACLIEEGQIGEEAFIVARGEVEVERRASLEAGAPVQLARLGAGALVGEMALLSRAPRAATVVTVRPTIVLVATKEALGRAAARAPRVGEEFAAYCKRRMIDNLVRTSALFRAASSAERPTLVERFALKTFEPGETLAVQGERSVGLHLIASGEVSVQHREGEERTLIASLGPGDVVGEVALIFRRPAIADAVAAHPTVTLFLPESRILDLVRELPKVFAELYELAVHRDLETASIANEVATLTEDYVIV